MKLKLQSLSLVLVPLLLCVTSINCVSLEDLDTMVRNNFESVCESVQCIGPVSDKQCPSGTRWIDGVSVYGCCGGCVRFLQEKETGCTGKIDTNSCNEDAGYGSCSAPARSSPIPRQGLVRSLTSYEGYPNVLSSSWCDYGLFCNSDNCLYDEDFVPCVAVQEAYDSDWESGRFVMWRDDFRWRPECESDGTYSPTQCKGTAADDTQTRLCADPTGTTLPGKAFSFQDDLFDDMNCLCSRRKYELELEGDYTTTLHCLDNGNYEPLQCADDWCYCIHPENGTVRGYQMPMAAINLLPCFNVTTVGDQYLRQCESQSNAHNVITKVMSEKGVLLSPVDSVACTYEGAYASSQCTGSSCKCHNKYNKDCQVNGPTGCDCVRDMLTYKEAGRSYASLQCGIIQGNYEEFQLVASINALYKVDKEGVRTTAILSDKCKEELQEGDLANCQNLGNQAISDEDYGYCDRTCRDDNEVCPDNVYVKYSTADGGYNTEIDECIP